MDGDPLSVAPLGSAGAGPPRPSLTGARFEEVGVHVVAGHLGALGGVLRSLGVTAADAELGHGETFDRQTDLEAFDPQGLRID